MKLSTVALSALGDPTRQEIVRLLAERPLAVNEIAAQLPVTRPAVSKHLRVLSAAGLVDRRSEGTRNVYRLRSEGLETLRNDLDSLWSSALQRYRVLAENTVRRRR